MIIFEKIRWKNLLSTGNSFVEIELNKTRNTILLGKSGSGKSTLLDAMSFVLFNKPFRNINKNQLVNSINQKNCVVEIEFSIGTRKYLVRRGVKPSVFEIYCNDKLVDQDSHTRDYQQYLEQSILKFNFKSFSQIIVLGASNFVPFMQLKPSDRRVIIETLLDIEIFSVMNSIIKKKISILKSDMQDVEQSFVLCNEKRKIQIDHIQELSDNKDAKIKENEQLISKNKEQAKELLSENVAYEESKLLLEKKIEFRDDVQNKIDTIRTINTKLMNSIKKSNKEVSFYENNSSCPTCRQDIAEQIRLEQVDTNNKKIKEWENGLTEAESALDKLKAKIKVADSIQSDIDSIESSIVKNKNTVTAIRHFISKIESEIDKLKNTNDNQEKYKEQLQSIEDEIVKLQVRKEELLNNKEVYDIATALLKDDGIKARIIKQYLPLINKHTNVFLNAMNFFVSFNIDEEFNESIKSRNRDEFSYENFSEGEKQRIDLALLLTWRTIAKLKNSINTNLLIMDEVLDSYLDTFATENVLQLLNSDMFKSTNIFVISHKETISDKFNRTINFTKSKNFSTID